MQVTEALQRAFAPTGRLRASINLGNPILATRNPSGGAPTGVSVDLATELAQRLGLPLELVVFDAAGKSVEAVRSERTDFGFFAIDPLRGQGIHFSIPYVLIEGSYLVREDSMLMENGQVDQAGHRVVVGKGSAYDLFLTRELRHAEIIRAPTSPAVVDTFIAEGAEVAAGVRQQLEADAGRLAGLRLLPGRFMVIRQAMGLPDRGGPIAFEYLAVFVKDVIGSGFVGAALSRHGILGAAVAQFDEN
ncbi:ABC transporter substrate-binding protein [Cupriavidus sp. SK-3]|uniref:ABC transporter substrate-binding protein n=1 Tax=Cupriavidus sp. SK-3 TaxID=1470558 RepID=UPI00044DD11F|nr:ABC transporter substrate-binding protein [Cupriavidus sp. SK-3]KDP85454.1 ABC transporter substrate-binding protein [Cupriavidus sp. SK-3]